MIAIEMFELHQKKKMEQSVAKKSDNFQAVSNNTNNNSNGLTKDNSTNYVTNFQTNFNASSRVNQSTNNFYNNLVPGEILKPQPLNKSAHSSRSAVHSDCDKPRSDINLTSKLRGNLVNPKEFENYDSSPFDNVELQTIDEIKELNNVFQALNSNFK